MKLAPETYLIILRGRAVGTVTYQHGLLISVQLTTGVRDDVTEAMAKLPSLEKNLFHAQDDAIGYMNVANLQITRRQPIASQ